MESLTSSQVVERRTALGMTQRRLAEEFGVDVTTVQRWESGKGKVPPMVDGAFQALEARHESPLTPREEEFDKVIAELGEQKLRAACPDAPTSVLSEWMEGKRRLALWMIPAILAYLGR
jgi:transcriptional regulator with XRE-family HTH domain